MWLFRGRTGKAGLGNGLHPSRKTSIVRIFIRSKGTSMVDQPSPHRKALVFAVDENEYPFALFAARRAAQLSALRDFDILIFSLDNLTQPDGLAELGIRTIQLDLRDEIEAAELPLHWFPLVVYLRLWLPGVLQDRYDRILYTDADTYLVTHELNRLFDVDLGQHAIGAVADKVQWENPDKPVLEFDLNKMPVTKYMNSGLCLIDVSKYLEQNLLERIIETAHAGHKLIFHDQSLINLTLAGNWAELSPVWNWQWTNPYPWFTQQIGPKILHFGGPAKPWRAASRKTSFDANIIAEYQQFLSDLNAPQAFSLNKPGGLRPNVFDKLYSLGAQVWLYPAFRRLAARFPDPWTTRL